MGYIEDILAQSRGDRNDFLSMRMDKIQRLQTAAVDKASRLNLDPLGTNNIDGIDYSNANKIYNDFTDAQLQQYLSDVADQQVYANEDGSMYQYHYDPAGNPIKIPYVGDTRRLYAYGTKDSDTEIKAGLARGDASSSDVRYIPGLAEKQGLQVGRDGYGWEPGQSGVDVAKNRMDLLLPYDVATRAEGMLHGRANALKNRSVLPTDVSGRQARGSGASEYYKSAEGLFGDTSNSTDDPNYKLPFVYPDRLKGKGKFREADGTINKDGRVLTDFKAAAASVVSYLAGAADSIHDMARNAAVEMYGEENIDNKFEKWFFGEKDNKFLNHWKNTDNTKEAMNVSTRYLQKAEKDVDRQLANGNILGALKEVAANTDVYLAESAGEMGLLAFKAPGFVLSLGKRVNDDIDEYKKNHNGDSPSDDRVAEMLLGNATALGMEKFLVFGPLKKIFAQATGKIPKNKITQAIAGTAGSATGEALQEVFDTAQQKYTTTDKMITKEEAIKSAVTGAGMGGTMRATGEVGAAILSPAKQKLLDRVNAAKEANIDPTAIPDKNTKEFVGDLGGRFDSTVKEFSETRDFKTFNTKLSELEKEAIGVDNESIRKNIQDVREIVSAQYSTEPVKPEDAVLGSREDAEKLIVDVMLGSKKTDDPTLLDNIETIAKANGISVDELNKLTGHIKGNMTSKWGLKRLESEYGTTGFKTYGRELRKAVEANNEADITKYTDLLANFQDTQITKLKTLQSAYDTTMAALNEGTFTDNKIVVDWGKGRADFNVDRKNKKIQASMQDWISEAQYNVDGIEQQLSVVSNAQTTTTETKAPVSTAEPKVETQPEVKPVSVPVAETVGESEYLKEKFSPEVFRDVVVSSKSGSKLAESDIRNEPIPVSVGDKTYQDAAVQQVQDTLLEEPTDPKLRLEFRKESPARGIIFTTGGKGSTRDGAINPNAAVAVKAAADEFIAFNSDMLRKKTARDIARVLGIEEFQLDDKQVRKFNEWGMLYSNVADTTGQMVAKNLGMSMNKKDGTREQYGRIISDLGNTSIGLLLKEGMVELHDVPYKDYIEMITGPVEDETEVKRRESMPPLQFIRMGARYNARTPEGRGKLLKALGDRSNTVNEALGLPTNTISYFTEPLEPKKSYTIRGGKLGNVPKLVVEALNKLRKIEYVKLDILDGILNSSYKDRFLPYALGYKDVATEEAIITMSKEDRDSQDAKNQQILKSIDDLYAMQDKEDIYFDWFYGSNRRYYLDSNGVNPQTDLLHRFTVIPRHQIMEVDPESSDYEYKMDKLYYAAAQAMGYDVDKNKIKDSIAEGKKYFNMSKAEILKIVQDSKGKKAKHLGHILQLLDTKKKMDEANGGVFEATLSAEFDGLTSGFAIRLMQFPILNKMADWFKRVGVIAGKDKITSMSDEISNPEFYDSYQYLAKIISSKKEIPLVVKDDTYLFEAQTKIYDSIKEYLPKAGVDGVISSELRALFKDPFMIFNYAAGMARIKKNLAGVIAKDIYAGIAKGDKKYDALIGAIDMQPSKYKNLREALLNEYPEDIKVRGFWRNASLEDAISNVLENSYGKAVIDVMGKEFGEFKELNSVLSNVSSQLFAQFKEAYDAKINKVKSVGDGRVTEAIRGEILNELKDKFPFLKTAISDEGDVFSNLPLYKKDRVDTTDQKVNTKLKNSRLKTTPYIKDMKEGAVSGAVIPIQAIDGSTMNDVILSYIGQYIHDAIIPAMDEAEDAVKKYNEAWYTHNSNYSIIEELDKLVERSGVDLDVTINPGKDNEFNLLAKFNATVRTVKKARAKWLPAITQVAQMVGLEGSIHETGNKPVSVVKTEVKTKPKYSQQEVDIISAAKSMHGLTGILKDIKLEDC